MIRNVDLLSPFNDTFSEHSVSISSNSTAALQLQLEIENVNLDSSFELYKKPSPDKKNNSDSQLKNELEDFEKHILSESNWDFLKYKAAPLNDKKGLTKRASSKSKYSRLSRSEKSLSLEANTSLLKKKKSRNISTNSLSFPSLKRKSSYSNCHGTKSIDKAFDDMVQKITECGKDVESNFLSNNHVRFTFEPTSKNSNCEPLVTSNDLNLNIIANAAMSPELSVNSSGIRDLKIQDQTAQNLNASSSTSHLLRNSSSFRSLTASSKNGGIASILSARLNHEELPLETDEMIMENKVFNDMKSVKRLTDNMKILSIESDEEIPMKTKNSEKVNGTMFIKEDSNKADTISSGLNLDEWNQFLDEHWKIKDDVLPEMFSLDENISLMFLRDPKENETDQKEGNSKESKSKTVKTKKKNKKKKNLKKFSSFMDLFSGNIKDDSDFEIEKKKVSSKFEHRSNRNKKITETSDKNYCVLDDSPNFDSLTCKHCGRCKAYFDCESCNQKRFYHQHHNHKIKDDNSQTKSNKFSNPNDNSDRKNVDYQCDKSSPKEICLIFDTGNSSDQYSQSEDNSPGSACCSQYILNNEIASINFSNESKTLLKITKKNIRKRNQKKNKSNHIEKPNNKLKKKPKKKVSILEIIMPPKKDKERQIVNRREMKNSGEHELIELTDDKNKDKKINTKQSIKIHIKRSKPVKRKKPKDELISHRLQEAANTVDENNKYDEKTLQRSVFEEKKSGLGSLLKLMRINSPISSCLNTKTVNAAEVDYNEVRIENKSNNRPMNSDKFPQMQIDPKFLNDTLTVKPFPYGGISKSSFDNKTNENNILNNNFFRNTETNVSDIKKNPIHTKRKLFNKQEYRKKMQVYNNMNKSCSCFKKVEAVTNISSDENDDLLKIEDTAQRDETLSFNLKSLFRPNVKNAKGKV